MISHSCRSSVGWLWARTVEDNCSKASLSHWVCFCTLAAGIESHLNEDILLELVCHEEYCSLDSLIDLVIYLDTLLQKPPAVCQELMLPDPAPHATPMQLPHTQLSTSDWDRRWCEQLCIYCGGADHVICACHRLPDMHSIAAGEVKTLCPHAVSPFTLNSSSCFTVHVQIRHAEFLFTLAALINSRATGNFIDKDTVTRLQLPVHPLQQHFWVCAIDGSTIRQGEGTHSTKPIHLQVAAIHHEHKPLLITVMTDHTGTPLAALFFMRRSYYKRHRHCLISRWLPQHREPWDPKFNRHSHIMYSQKCSAR